MALRDLHERAYGVGLAVGVEYRPPVHVARRAARRLDERSGRAQEAFLVGVEYRHQGDFGEVEPLAQQVYAHQAVEFALAQAAEDRDALDGVDAGVQVFHAQARFAQVVGQVFRGFLRESGDERAVAALRGPAHFFDQVVDLVCERETEYSYSPGVAEAKTTCPTRESNSSNVSGRLSFAEGRRKP